MTTLRATLTAGLLTASGLATIALLTTSYAYTALAKLDERNGTWS